MEKGLSTWLFSKIVMLIFLLMIFGIVTTFLGTVRENTNVDSAESITAQIKDAIKVAVTSDTISSSVTVPISRTIPSEESAVGVRAQYYSIDIRTTVSGVNKIISVSLKWAGETTYIASSNYISKEYATNPSTPVVIDSKTNSFIKIMKENPNVYICGCETSACSVKKGVNIWTGANAAVPAGVC